MIAVQCWDDGVLDDIRVIEILRKHGAKGSFNLNFTQHQENRYLAWKFQGTKEVWKLSKGELKDVYQDFLVANHTLTHPSLTDVPVEKAIAEVQGGRDQLEQWFGYSVEGFAYPNGAHNPSVHDVVRNVGHLYARTVDNVARIFPVADPMCFNPNCHFLNDDFWQKFEKVKAEDGIFYFWGHSYEILSEKDWQNFDEKIARISREAQWKDLPELFRK